MSGNRSCINGHPHAIGLAIAVLALFASCGDTYPSVFSHGIISEGRADRTSVAFAMNGRPVKLELCIRVEGTSATIKVDHPDGRTQETIEVPGPGIRELCKDFPKEPGSWGLQITANGGSVAYWVALHDRRNNAGPDDDSRRFVERN